jgi:hypothetical protein
MQAKPDVDPISKDAPRVQLNLPNVYWTLNTQFATIIGMYTNVPEGGSIDSTQQQWVTNEFATAPTDRALILALHHPIYSFDVYHSGSSKMADVLENAIRDTGRVPNLVLSGHVHDYQRIEQTIAPGGPTPFIVTGNGGYHNLHAVHSKPGDKAPDSNSEIRRDEDVGILDANRGCRDDLGRRYRSRSKRPFHSGRFLQLLRQSGNASTAEGGADSLVRRCQRCDQAASSSFQREVRPAGLSLAP